VERQAKGSSETEIALYFVNKGPKIKNLKYLASHHTSLSHLHNLLLASDHLEIEVNQVEASELVTFLFLDLGKIPLFILLQVMAEKYWNHR
jgi:hypothetical protein